MTLQRDGFKVKMVGMGVRPMSSIPTKWRKVVVILVFSENTVTFKHVEMSEKNKGKLRNSLLKILKRLVS